MPGCMAGVVRTLLSVMSVSVHICACRLCCPDLFLSSVMSYRPFMFCVGVFWCVADFNCNVYLSLLQVRDTTPEGMGYGGRWLLRKNLGHLRIFHGDCVVLLCRYDWMLWSGSLSVQC